MFTALCPPPEDTRTRRQNRSYNVRMSIYIDPPTWPAHSTVFSHLISDASLAELHAFAAAAGISERAFDRDHYDVPAHLYDELVRAGAVELSGAELTRTLIASGLRIPLKERPEKIRPRLLRAWEAAFAPRLNTPRLKHVEAPAELRTQLTAQVAELGESLLQAWEQPHRAYHHSGHLSQILTDLDRLYAHRTQAGSTPLALILAAWFHDAVYEGAPGEDERRSEQLANASLEPLVTAGLLDVDELQMVSLLVRATATHELPGSADLPAGYERADIQFFSMPIWLSWRLIRHATAATCAGCVASTPILTLRHSVPVVRPSCVRSWGVSASSSPNRLSSFGRSPRGLICKLSSASGSRTRRGFCRLSRPSRIHLKHIPPRMRPY